MAASAVGEDLGVSGGIVLRSAHSGGLPVRAGGSTRPSIFFDIQLVDALYDDIEVAHILAAHNVPISREPGPIWLRFPTPVALTKGLLMDLYSECGLSCFHIELLTGVPVRTILRRLDRFGIARRGRGGRSPFIKRWRDRQRMLVAQDHSTTPRT